MNYILKNENLKVTISDAGAEILSIINEAGDEVSIRVATFMQTIAQSVSQPSAFSPTVSTVITVRIIKSKFTVLPLLRFLRQIR